MEIYWQKARLFPRHYAIDEGNASSKNKYNCFISLLKSKRIERRNHYSYSFQCQNEMWNERARWMTSHSLIKESHNFNIWHNHSLNSIRTNISVCTVLIGHYPHCEERNIDGSMGDDNLNCFFFLQWSIAFFFFSLSFFIFDCVSIFVN